MAARGWKREGLVSEREAVSDARNCKGWLGQHIVPYADTDTPTIRGGRGSRPLH